MIGAELNGSAPAKLWGDYALLANLGTAYALTDGIQLQASLGRTLRDTLRGGPESLAQFFVQWNFGG